MIHLLKTWPKYYEQVISGRKTFEIRENDRNFKVGDEIVLCEFDPDTKKSTGRDVSKTVTYITDFMQKPGYVVMAFKNTPITIK